MTTLSSYHPVDPLTMRLTDPGRDAPPPLTNPHRPKATDAAATRRTHPPRAFSGGWRRPSG